MEATSNSATILAQVSRPPSGLAEPGQDHPGRIRKGTGAMSRPEAGQTHPGQRKKGTGAMSKPEEPAFTMLLGEIANGLAQAGSALATLEQIRQDRPLNNTSNSPLRLSTYERLDSEAYVPDEHSLFDEVRRDKGACSNLTSMDTQGQPEQEEGEEKGEHIASCNSKARFKERKKTTKVRLLEEWVSVDDSFLATFRGSARIRHIESANPNDGTSSSNSSYRFVSGAEKTSATARALADELWPCKAWVVHPQSLERCFWDLLSCLCMAYDLVTLPMMVFNVENSEVMKGIGWFSVIFWTLDLLMSTRTGFFDGVELQMEPVKVAVHYGKTFLVPDLLIVSLEWIVRLTEDLQLMRQSGLGRITKGMRIFRVVRLLRLSLLAKKIETSLTSAFWRLFFSMWKMGCLLFFAVHTLTCGWYGIGTAFEGWAVPYEHETLMAKYLEACRWTLSQINGRTDQEKDRNSHEKLYTCGVGIFTIMFMSFFVSSVTTHMVELQGMLNQKNQYTRLLNAFLDRHRLSWGVVLLAREHAKRLESMQNEKEDESCILSMLPKHLQHEVLYELRSPILMAHPLFKYLKEFGRAMYHVASMSTKPMQARSTEIVFEKGDPCYQMMFILQGSFRYSLDISLKKKMVRAVENPQPEELAKQRSSRRNKLARVESTWTLGSIGGEELKDGSWICEAALWIQWTHQGELLAAADGTMLAVARDSFIKVLENYGEARALASMYARCFAAQAQKARLSDVMPAYTGSLMKSRKLWSLRDSDCSDFSGRMEGSRAGRESAPICTSSSGLRVHFSDALEHKGLPDSTSVRSDSRASGTCAERSCSEASNSLRLSSVDMRHSSVADRMDDGPASKTGRTTKMVWKKDHEAANDVMEEAYGLDSSEQGSSPRSSNDVPLEVGCSRASFYKKTDVAQDGAHLQTASASCESSSEPAQDQMKQGECERNPGDIEPACHSRVIL